jgi:hypothetical protein
MKRPGQELPDAVYNRIFQQDVDGEKILEELATHYYDRQSYVAGDPHATSFNEGARSVISYILGRSGTKE